MNWLLVALAACSSATDPRLQTPPALAPADAPADVTSAPAPAVDAAPPVDPEVWLRGSTHVHTQASGDSKSPIPEVIDWYENHGYDFIAITDHNQVSEIDLASDTTGKPWLRDPKTGLIVLSGIELTENATGCLPAGDASGKCRVHLNLIGTPARPRAKLKGWIDQKTRQRVAKYQAALTEAKHLGGVVQLNHPQWFWGMTTDVLVEAARRGVVLLEVANIQFKKWNAGDKDHLSSEALWDAALAKGVMLWGVASDDAHQYDGGGKYPAGGAYVVVKARRDPQAIVDALAAGRFYASTGVALDRVEVDGDALVVEIAAADAANTITFVDNGVRTTTSAKSARHLLPATGYVRAVVDRPDGAKAWTQPAHR